MVVTERQPLVKIEAPESEFLQNRRLEQLARERQNAFQSEKAQEYWKRTPERLISYWQGFFANRMKNKPGISIDIPIVPPCPFPEELLLEFKDKGILPLFIPDIRIKHVKNKEENIPIADLDRIFEKAQVKEAVNKNPVVDLSSLGWTVVKPMIDPPYRNTSRLEMEKVRTQSNIGHLGFFGYLILADLMEDLTTYRIDSAENNSSRLFPVSIGGFQSPMFGFDNGKLRITSLGVADTHKQDNSGWR